MMRIQRHLLVVCAAVFVTLACQYPARGDVDMALVAEPSTSHVSGDTSLKALNDGVVPNRSDDRSKGSYGNWPSKGTQWVQYEWDKPISTNRIQVFWWDDHMGVRLPAAARLLYWDGHAFVPVNTKEKLGVARDTLNTLRFDTVTTPKLRLEIDGSGEFSTGILEWRVIDSGDSPAFAPRVHADHDRTVMLNGMTYLGGTVKTLKGECTTTWRKQSGPGQVTFVDASRIDTAAGFSEPGRYVLGLTASLGDLSASDTLNVQVVQGPPDQSLHPVDTMPYRINSPLWSGRAKTIIVNWIPHCIAKINDPNLPEGGINNFIEAGKKLRGEPAGKHRGYVFSNAWVYNTMESICVALMVDAQGDPQILKAQADMRKTLNEWIPIVLSAQEPDGYLQTVFTLRGWPHWSVKHRTDHEGYTAGYFLDAAVAHYMLTGGKDLRLYNAAKKLADCWVRHIGPLPKQPWYDEHQGMEMALVRFGRFVNTVEGGGKGEKYIQLAKFLLDCRKDGNAYSQSHVPVIRQYEAVGHAVRASYNYAAMSDVAMETHNTDYQSAVMSLFDNMVNRKYYLTGGIGSGETPEGFGPDYSLRQNAYCESCSSCGLIFFEHKLNLAYHDAKYADLYEQTLYNALLGSIDLDGRNFYYQNPLTEHHARYPWHNCPCCVGNIPRVLLRLPTWTYLRGDKALYVNLFVGSTINVPNIAGTNVQMVQQTNYPWDGKVAITVNPDSPTDFALHIRVPNRDDSKLYTATPEENGISSIKVNGETITPPVVDGYAVIQRKWTKGDKVEMELPMAVQVIRGDDKIAATRGKVALRYGPLIYTVESADQPLDKTVDPNSQFTAEWDPDRLGGVVVIHGQWSDGTPLLAVPYYARFNEAGRPGQDQTSEVWIKAVSQ